MKVLYVTSNGGIHDYRFLQKLVEDYEVLLLHYASYELVNEIKSLNQLKIISKKPWPKNTFPYLSEKRHFKKIYDEFKPDIVHTGYVWQVGILAAHYNLHPHLSMVWGSDTLFEPDNNRYLKRLVKKVMNQCDKIQCDAEFVKKKIIQDYNVHEQKISVFPWGIDLNIFKPIDKTLCRTRLKLSPDKFIVIFNRSLEPVYSVQDLLEGFKLFSGDKDDVYMLMLSDGSLKNEVNNFISRNNLKEKINLIGRVPNNDLPDFLNASDVYISTALSDGTSLAMLEAFACGLPVIVTDVPAIKEWVSESNGIIIPKSNPEKVSGALNKYYNDKQLMRTHSQKNTDLAKQKANWDINYLRLKELYSELVHGYNAK